jgi:hypothetical protein
MKITFAETIQDVIRVAFPREPFPKRSTLVLDQKIEPPQDTTRQEKTS